MFCFFDVAADDSTLALFADSCVDTGVTVDAWLADGGSTSFGVSDGVWLAVGVSVGCGVADGVWLTDGSSVGFNVVVGAELADGSCVGSHGLYVGSHGLYVADGVSVSEVSGILLSNTSFFVSGENGLNVIE